MAICGGLLRITCELLARCRKLLQVTASVTFAASATFIISITFIIFIAFCYFSNKIAIKVFFYNFPNFTYFNYPYNFYLNNYKKSKEAAAAAKLAQNYLIKQPNIGILFPALRDIIKPRHPPSQSMGDDGGAQASRWSRENRDVREINHKLGGQQREKDSC